MDKLPVGQLPDISQSSLDDEIMIITEADTSQLRKEKISNILTDIISVQENNALVKGSDDKLFVTNFGNASNITEGTLPTSVLPQIPTEKLPQTGVEAGEYSYPSSVTVNAQGQITAIEEGQTGANNANQDLSNLSPEGEQHFLNKTQVTNCMLEAPNGVATYSGTTVTVQEGTNYLFPNGRNSNNTLQNTTFTAASNITGTMSGSTAGTFVVFVTSELELIFANQSNYFITNTQPTALNDSTTAGVWFNPQTNLIYQCTATASTPSWSTFEGAICATLSYDGSTITAFNPIYPIELSNKLNIDHSNDPKPYIKTMMDNGNGNGYIIYSNGYAVQYGHYQVGSVDSLEITFYKQFKNTNYIFNRSPIWVGGATVSNDYYAVGCNVKETTKVSLFTHTDEAVSSIDWVATGYLAEGEY